MKNKLFIFSIIALSIGCNNEKQDINKTTIISTIKGLKDSTFIILKTPKASGFRNVDSTYVINESFNLSATQKNTVGSLYYIDIKEEDKTLFSFKFWNDKNRVSIRGDFNKKEEISVENSTLNSLIKDYDTIMRHYSNELTKIITTTKDASKRDDAFTEAFRLIKEKQIDFLFKHPNNAFSLHEVFRFTKQLSKDSLSLYYKSLNETLQETTKGQYIKEYFSATKIEIGKPFIDFTAKDMDGKTVALSDFNDKIIVLDFWAYWCTWCHVQNEKEFSYLFKKYKKDAVIISYALDEKQDVWEKSVTKSSYKWINLSNLKGMKDPVAYRYKVKALPHTFIIDRKGIVQKEFIGYEKDSLIEKELMKLIKKKH